ncbi:hypothetical protein [Marininema halotolerans]|uniref:Uncharacterized protein n=1 Tax=Marininema halotolerans TaxID=1155944 RepID=A0A1I6PNR8_9BACL|nr:hypothetical protein [Marininema halotolerans]SFS41728.1 hypothetical protein SAMN05444972_10232 [Marininema halotolerans]
MKKKMMIMLMILVVSALTPILHVDKPNHTSSQGVSQDVLEPTVG